MATRVVISDAGCFIAFDRINQLEILHNVFGSVLTTSKVVQEFGKKLPTWVIITDPANQRRWVELEQILDEGEASAIALALEVHNPVIIIDEKKGRNLAKSLHLEVIGSLKILLLAKQKGFIDTIRPLILALENQNFRFSKILLEHVFLEAGEKL